MSAKSLSPTRRELLLATAAAGAMGVLPATLTVAATNDAIRPFDINIPESALVDLRRRVDAMRWPEKETVTDTSQGVPLGIMQELALYWATDYDWRKVE